MKKISIGIIGRGKFGTFLYDSLIAFPELDILVYDPKQGRSDFSLNNVDQFDIIILAIPLQAYKDVLKHLGPNLRADTLLIDVCSVKIKPEALIKHYLPTHTNVLLTHPLFGPQSAKDTMKGHSLVICNDSENDLSDRVLSFCKEKLGLKLYYYTPEEHDVIMAEVHALTFFVAKGLAALSVSKSPLNTPSYKMILELQEFSKTHSDDLFDTIESGNPFAKEIRQKLIKNFTEIDDMTAEYLPLN